MGALLEIMQLRSLGHGIKKQLLSVLNPLFNLCENPVF